MEEREVQDIELIDLDNRREDSEKHENRRRMEFDDGTKVVNWVENIVSLISRYGMKKLLQALFLVASVVCFIMFVNAVDNQKIIEEWIKKEPEIHEVGANIRKEVTPQISKALVRMLYVIEGDRVAILEMHNGKENPTSLPFLYCDMTYEETKDRVPYVSDEYEDLNMSKFNFITYIYENRYFIGTIEEIYSIDKKLAMRMELNNVKYCGIMLIRTNVDIGFLMVSYLNEPTINEHKILAELSYYAQEVGTYLDYTKQVENKKKWFK
ncbi:MAG: hypothetical protein IKT40_09025 [Bacilli bacterium]|nr:hypothetical protein [Bacilli bacterium]